MAGSTGAATGSGSASAVGGNYVPDNPAAQIVREHGRLMTLRRSSEATQITLVGKPIPGSPVDLNGTARQQQMRVKIGPTEIGASSWAQPWPLRTDTLEHGGRERSVLGVRTIRHNGAVWLYELTVAG